MAWYFKVQVTAALVQAAMLNGLCQSNYVHAWANLMCLSQIVTRATHKWHLTA